MMIDGKHIPNHTCSRCKYRHPPTITCEEAKHIAIANSPEALHGKDHATEALRDRERHIATLRNNALFAGIGNTLDTLVCLYALDLSLKHEKDKQACDIISQILKAAKGDTQHKHDQLHSIEELSQIIERMRTRR